jgi:hypothetical protein
MAFTVIGEYDALHRGPGEQQGGVCFTCGAPRRNQMYRPGGELVVDLGPTVDHVTDLDNRVHSFRKVAVCETCIRELTVIAGGVVQDQVDRDNVEHWKARALQAEKDLEQRNKVIGQMQRISV